MAKKRPTEMTSAELRKEKHEAKMKYAKKLINELRSQFSSIRNKFNYYDRTGNIPDEGILRGYRKKLQYLSGGLRKLQRIQVEPPFNRGAVNIQLARVRKWLDGEVTGKKKPGTDQAPKADRQPTIPQTVDTTPKLNPEQCEPLSLDEIMKRMKLGASSVSDPAVQEAVIILREIVMEHIINVKTVMVANRAKKLMGEEKRSEKEIENYLEYKIIAPVLSTVVGGFMSQLTSADVNLNEKVKRYIETCIDCGKTRSAYIHMLMRAQVATRSNRPPSYEA